MCAIIRVVVVLPLEPVTAMIGIRLGVPGGNSPSTTCFATYCGSPSVGCVCIRNPGAAFTSTIAPPVSRTGCGDVGREEVDAGDVETDDPRRLLGDLDVVLVRLPGAVDRDAAGRHVAGGGEQHPLALGRHVVDPEALLLHELDRGVVDLDPREHLLVADAAPRVLVRLVDEPRGPCAVPSPITWAGTRSAIATMRPPITSTR